jgi:hypothetical protein
VVDVTSVEKEHEHENLGQNLFEERFYSAGEHRYGKL